MQDLGQLDRIRRVLTRLALVTSLVTALSLPLGYLGLSYWNLKDRVELELKAHAEGLSQLIYATGPAWPYAEERIVDELRHGPHDHDRFRHTVLDRRGEVVAVVGSARVRPVLRRQMPVTVGGRTAATVQVETSLWPVLLQTDLVALFGLLLGAAVYMTVRRFPLRVLDSLLDQLRETMAQVEAHATETDYAYTELQRQHRIVEERTDELRRARNEAIAANRAKSVFLANMSHELRTPLNAIIGFSEIMEDELLGPLGNPKYREYIHDISQSGSHLLSIINDILDFSKIEAGKLELHLRPVDALELAKSCCQLVRKSAQQHDISLLVVEPSAPLPPVTADPVRLKQILINLLSNAIKFTHTGGQVSIELEPSDDNLNIRVTDSGIGMTREEAERALQPFEQVDSDLNRRHDGTGLGLPLSLALARKHGGDLTIDSAPGHGTSVALILPTSAPAVLARTGSD